MSENANTPAPQDENQLIAERREKLAAIRQRARATGKGVAFPNDFKPAHRAAPPCSRRPWRQDARSPGRRRSASPASIAGRMMLKRVMGKASFATLQDATGRSRFT